MRRKSSPESVMHAVHSTALAVTILLCAGVATLRAQSAEIISTYTSTAKKDCKAMRPSRDDPDPGFDHVCPGMAGLVVYNVEGDLREVVSVGRTRAAAQKEPAGQTFFGPFSSTTNTIEWRHPKGGAPFAIVQRWHLADNDDPGPDNRPRTKQMLVVTRLPPGPVWLLHCMYSSVAVYMLAAHRRFAIVEFHFRSPSCGGFRGWGGWGGPRCCRPSRAGSSRRARWPRSGRARRSGRTPRAAPWSRRTGHR